MNMDITLRQNQLTHLRTYFKNVDSEVTMILQNLQWDRKHLAKRRNMVACQCDTSHKVPAEKLVEHENGCLLKSQGYSVKECLLPNPVDPDAATLVKLNANNIADIINNASHYEPLFKTGAGCSGHQPLTLERLQATYTADERRAIHDAVVNQVPSCHDLSDLAILSSKDDIGKETKTKSKLEILAELRDMRRRRTKYRVAAKTRNYSDVLRDVIITQMDLYGQAHKSTSHIDMNSNDCDNNNKTKDDRSKERSKTSYCDKIPNKTYQSADGLTSVFTKDICHIPQSSRHHEEYINNKRKYNESDRNYSSTRYCKSLQHDEYKDHTHSNNESKRRNDRDKSAKTNRKTYKHHDHYESRNRDREKEYERKRTSRTEDHSLITTKAQTTDNHDYYKNIKEMRHIYARHHPNTVRQDLYQYENEQISVKSRNSEDRKKRYECNPKQDQTVRIKNEEGNCHDSYRIMGKEPEYSDPSGTRYSSVKKYKMDSEVYVKKERDIVRDDPGNDYGSKSSDICNERKKSKTFYSGHSNFAKYKDKHRNHEKNKDTINYDDIQQQEHREIVIEKVKLEKERGLEKREKS